MEFLDDLSAAVADALGHTEIITSDEVRQDLRLLWTEVEDSRAELQSRLRAVAEGTDHELDQALAQVGLDGLQLAIKLRQFGRTKRAFEQMLGGGSGRRWSVRLRRLLFGRRRPWGDWIRAGRERPIKAVFRSLLRWGDVTLGSLVAAIPGGEAYKEAKEAIEAAVEDADDPDLE
jgi:hypothetical protein